MIGGLLLLINGGVYFHSLTGLETTKDEPIHASLRSVYL